MGIMTKEEIIEMARQAGVRDDENVFEFSQFKYLERFAKLVAEKSPQRTWVGLEKTDMFDGEDPMYDHPFFIAGMVWAANKLRKKNT